ncbi:MAG: hypothetical protein WCY49_06715 [Anaerovoracaceae bacterium]
MAEKKSKVGVGKVTPGLESAFSAIDKVIADYKNSLDQMAADLDAINSKIGTTVSQYKELQKQANALNNKLEKTQTVFYKGFDITQYYEQGESKKAQEVIDSVVTLFTLTVNGETSEKEVSPMFITRDAVRKLGKSKSLKKILALKRESNIGPATITLTGTMGDYCELRLVPSTEVDFLIQKVSFHKVALSLSMSGVEKMTSDLCSVSLKTIQSLFSTKSGGK